MPDPLAESRFGARALDIAVLVFREGLECILVLAAVTANLRAARGSFSGQSRLVPDWRSQQAS